MKKNIMNDERKKYYRFDNDDQVITCTWKDLIELLKAESDDVTEGENARVPYEWKIDLVWLTEEEFENLPEAE